MDAITPLVENIVHTTYEDIPDEARAAAKRTVIDTLGAFIAGYGAPGCKEVVNMVKEWGGREESTIITDGTRVPAPNAVWANVAMGRAREIDDCDEPTADHPSVVAVGVALAMAELLGGVTGKDLITAIVLGDDTVLRIRDACKRPTGKTPWGTGSYGVFNAATVAGRLLGLGEEKMLNALGLAFTQMSNTHQWVIDGALSGRVQHGLAARAGLLSALLAARGVTSPHNILEGQYGLYPMYEGNEYDRNRIFEGLGKEFRITRISVKPFACCKQLHASIQGTLELVNEYDIKPDEVDEVTIRINQVGYDLCGQPQRKEKLPESVPDAQFSIYYGVASAIVHREAFLSRFTPQAVKAPDVFEMGKKITVIADPELTALKESVSANIVDILTRNGKRYSTRVEHVPGHPMNSMSFEDCVEKKFKMSVDFSEKPLPKVNVEKVIGLVQALENVKDTAVILRYLVLAVKDLPVG